ncbi:MAG: FAD-dependent oxidoreductase [Firmicutes bacterium]|nr:FAD-dependent oxidoreductase [Bacillota bacterium]
MSFTPNDNTPQPELQVVIIGGVAGGMSTATRMRRLNASAQITVLERSGFVSFANCGLPYYVGGLIDREDDITLQTPESLYKRFRLDVRTGHEAVDIDTKRHVVIYKKSDDGTIRELPYDKLVISTGAKPLQPSIPGYENVHTLRLVEDANKLLARLDETPKTAVIIGAGFIGLEIAENLIAKGLEVHLIEGTNQVLPPLDPEMAIVILDELEKNGVHVTLGHTVTKVTDKTVTLSDGREINTDLTIGAIGVRPDNQLAQKVGLKLGPHGGIAVNEYNQTSEEDIYAVGDVIEKVDSVTSEPSFIALANVANRHGRRVADHIAGYKSHPSPSMGTAIVKVFSKTAASVGWSEKRLAAKQIPYRVVRAHPYSHATYYPGATPLNMKLLFSPDTKEILGAQIVGEEGVDKRIDVIATAMAGNLKVDQLADLELAYAPPFSSAKDPVNMLGYISENILSGECDTIEADELDNLDRTEWTLLDVRTKSEFRHGYIEGAINIPVDELRERLDEIPQKNLIVYCEIGLRGHTATTLLQELGYKVRNLDGGYRTYVTYVRSKDNAGNQE